MPLPDFPGQRRNFESKLFRAVCELLQVHKARNHSEFQVPCAPDITRARKTVLEWLRLRLLEPDTSPLELSARVPAREVFSSPALILEDIWEVMDAL